MFVFILLTVSDKVAVMIQIEQYVEVTETYQLREKPFGPKVAEIRYDLTTSFHLLAVGPHIVRMSQGNSHNIS